MKNAIVTGASGFIGYYLTKELVENGYHVWTVVRENTESYKKIAGIKNIDIVKCNLKEISGLPQKLKIEDGSVFYHLAWEGNSGDLRADYTLQLLNAKYACDAAEAAKKIGCSKFVMAGSVTQLMYRDFLRKDEIKPDMVTCYAIGKMSAEAMLKCICSEIKIDLCWTYIANFYGEDDPTNNFINFLIKNYMEKSTPNLTDANQLADFMYVSDVARALRLLGEKSKKNNSYYVGYGDPHPLKEYIEVIHKLIAPEIDAGIGRRKFAGESIDFNLIDYNKIKRDTGFEPIVDFTEGIQRVINSRKTE